MTALRFTLLSEGSSDRALIPILVWTLRQHSSRTFQPQWADLRGLARPLPTLDDRLEATFQLYPCELLFVHRDADRAGRESRVKEISKAVSSQTEQTAVCVVPVRALEAWLLFHEAAIRTAASNPNGSMPLKLPHLSQIETLLQPKKELIRLLQEASGLPSRRRRGVRWRQPIHRIAEIIEDFSPLRRLSAFRAFEKDLCQILTARGW